MEFFKSERFERWCIWYWRVFPNTFCGVVFPLAFLMSFTTPWGVLTIVPFAALLSLIVVLSGLWRDSLFARRYRLMVYDPDQTIYQFTRTHFGHKREIRACTHPLTDLHFRQAFGALIDENQNWSRYSVSRFRDCYDFPFRIVECEHSADKAMVQLMYRSIEVRSLLSKPVSRWQAETVYDFHDA